MKSIDSLRSLSYPPFRRLFIGASLSNVGTWIESVTVGIYMQSVTKQAVFVAGAMVVGFLPQAFMGFFSGSIVDRFNRKKVLIVNNLLACVLATLLATFVETGIAKPLVILGVLFIAGLLNSTSFPSWQAFLSDIVPKNMVPGALSLISAQWNFGRIIGPALAALLLAGDHYTIALSINAVSFLVVIAMLLSVKNKHHQPHSIMFTQRDTQVNDTSLLAGWKFILTPNSPMRKTFFAFCISIFWASPFIALIPNVADEVFKYKNLGTSLFTTFQGIGALIVSVLITTLHIKYGPSRTQQIFLFLLPFVLILFGLSPNLFFATPIALLFGITYLGTLNGTLLAGQLASPPHLKGRVSAAYLSTIGILYPVSSLLQGVFVELVNARVLFISTGLILFVCLTIFGFFTSSYRFPEPYDSSNDTSAHNIIESLGSAAPGE